MTDTALHTLDVRPTLRAGGEPFGEIMQAIAGLAPGQGLRLLATFKPEPLFAVMKMQGFEHSARPLENGEWEVVFTPTAPGGSAPDRRTGSRAGGKDGWPPPAESLDNRGLLPPEPMVRTLETLGHIPEGEVLEVWNDREPTFLYAELDARGHAVRTEQLPTGGFRLLIRSLSLGEGQP